MLIVALQTVILLTAILLPLRGVKKHGNLLYKIDKDTSGATLAINENGELERISSINPSSKKPSIEN